MLIPFLLSHVEGKVGVSDLFMVFWSSFFQRSGVAWINGKRVQRLSGGGTRLEYSCSGSSITFPCISWGWVTSLEFSPTRRNQLAGIFSVAVRRIYYLDSVARNCNFKDSQLKEILIARNCNWENGIAKIYNWKNLELRGFAIGRNRNCNFKEFEFWEIGIVRNCRCNRSTPPRQPKIFQINPPGMINQTHTARYNFFAPSPISPLSSTLSIQERSSGRLISL